MSKRKRTKQTQKPSGSMSKMRGGFKGIFKQKKKGKEPDPKQLLYMVLFMLAAAGLIFFSTR